MQTVIRSSAIVSENESWCFFGTCQSNYGLSTREAADLFNRAGQLLLVVDLADSPAKAAEFLDSRYGRHFADALSFRVAMPCFDVEALAKAAGEELLKARSIWLRAIKSLA